MQIMNKEHHRIILYYHISCFTPWRPVWENYDLNKASRLEWKRKMTGITPRIKNCVVGVPGIGQH